VPDAAFKADELSFVKKEQRTLAIRTREYAGLAIMPEVGGLSVLAI
jgi:hypothetical protein